MGAANQVYFIFVVTLFGLFSGAAVFTAQYWGARDLQGIRHLIGIDYIIAIVFAVVVATVAYTLGPDIIRLFPGIRRSSASGQIISESPAFLIP